MRLFQLRSPQARIGLGLLASALLLWALLAGCVQSTAPSSETQPASEEESTEATQEPIVLKFPTWSADDAAYGPWWRALIEEYESTHPNVTIDMTKVARAEFADTLITQFAGGDPPEITHLAAFEFPQFANEGWLEPLDKWMEGTDIAESWTGQDFCIRDGETQCIMLLYFGSAMVYNEKLLDEAGVAVPTNYEEFITAAEAVTQDTDGDGVIDQYGVGLHTTGGSPEMSNMMHFTLDTGSRFTDQAGECTIDTPEMIEGFRRWKYILENRLTPLDLDSGKARQLLLEGKVAMLFDGPWIYGILADAGEDVRPYLKIAPSPFQPPMGGESNVISIPKDIPEDEKQLAWDFIYLLTRPEWMRDYVVALGGSPAPRKGVATDEILDQSPYYDVFSGAMQAASDAGVSRTPKGLEIHVNEFVKYLHEESQSMLIQDKSPEQAAKDLQQVCLELKSAE